MEKSIHRNEYRILTTLLLEERERAQMTQAELASNVGEVQSFVAKYESNERRLDVLEVRDLCDAIGISWQDLLTNWATQT